MATKLFDMGRAPIKESLSPETVGAEKPSPYSYEHRISLNNEDMEKLGMNEPQVGDVFHVLGEGHVQSVDQSEHQNGDKTHNVSLQLKKMAIKARSKSGPSMLGAVSKGIQDSSADEGE